MKRGKLQNARAIVCVPHTYRVKKSAFTSVATEGGRKHASIELIGLDGSNQRAITLAPAIGGWKRSCAHSPSQLYSNKLIDRCNCCTLQCCIVLNHSLLF
jgi:hypothetical protein